MRRAIVVAIVTLLAVDSAAACHKYSRWYYPWRQSCRVTALAPRSVMRLAQRRISVSMVAEQRHEPNRPVVLTPDIAIPSLADIEWGHLADDDMRGRLLLHVILEGKEVK